MLLLTVVSFIASDFAIVKVNKKFLTDRTLPVAPNYQEGMISLNFVQLFASKEFWRSGETRPSTKCMARL